MFQCCQKATHTGSSQPPPTTPMPTRFLGQVEKWKIWGDLRFGQSQKIKGLAYRNIRTVKLALGFLTLWRIGTLCR